MGTTFSLWAEVKAYAKGYAESDRPLPCDEPCRKWLREIIDRHLLYDRQRHEAFDFYASELDEMIAGHRRERTA